MPRRYESSEAVCPFYKMESATTIWCEGLEAGGQVQIVSANAKKAARRKARFCRRNWKQCYIAKILTQIYEEGGEK